MPPSEACEEALRKYEAAKTAVEYASKLYILSEPGEQRDRAYEKLRQRQRELDEAIDQVAAACGERVTVIETGESEDDRFELRCHPLIPEHREREIREILDRIPENHKRGLRKLTLHFKQPPAGEGETGQKAAEYDREGKVIGHYHPNDVASIKHEIGHHVFWDRLNDAARQRWDRFFAAHKAAMPTGYARTKAKEGFAEVYEFYYDRKDLDPAVKAEFEEIIALVQ